MNELTFPKADEGNEEIEEWCNEVMQNWRILCGDEWQDDDLGSGGKEAVGRGVLDVGHNPTLMFSQLTMLRRYCTERLQNHFIQRRFYGTFLQYILL